MRVLAIDDDRNMRTTYGFWLEETGYALTCVADRKEAEVALERDRWDVVLLDQNLLGPAGGPVGLELVETIRAFSPAAAIIVISGAPSLAIKRAFELGVDDYLVKDQWAKDLLLAKLGLIARLVQQNHLLRQTIQEREDAIAAAWRELQTVTDKFRKGRLLEDLLAALLLSLPGVRNVTARLSNEVEELDLLVETDGAKLWSAFQATPHVLVECKNWSTPVGRSELDVLEKKMERRHGFVRLGIFVAWTGVTKPFHLTASRDQSKLIIVADRTRLANLVAAADRAHVVNQWIRSAIADADLEV